jgi:tetratricopeptide (TPR) repeat protein
MASKSGLGDSCLQNTSAGAQTAAPQKRDKTSRTEQRKKAAPATATKLQPKPAQEQPAKQALPGQVPAAPTTSSRTAGRQDPARDFAAARDLILTGRYEAGIKAMQALGFDSHPDVAAYIGLAHSKLGRVTEAASWYDKALAGNPRHLLSLSYYGMLRAEQGDLAKAQENLDTIKGVCGGTTCKEYIALDATIASKRR